MQDLLKYLPHVDFYQIFTQQKAASTQSIYITSSIFRENAYKSWYSIVKSLSSDIHPDCEKMYHNNVQSMTCNPYVIMHLQNMSSCLGFSLRGMWKERKEKACNDDFVFFRFSYPLERCKNRSVFQTCQSQNYLNPPFSLTRGLLPKFPSCSLSSLSMIEGVFSSLQERTEWKEIR